MPTKQTKSSFMQCYKMERKILVKLFGQQLAMDVLKALLFYPRYSHSQQLNYFQNIYGRCKQKSAVQKCLIFYIYECKYIKQRSKEIIMQKVFLPSLTKIHKGKIVKKKKLLPKSKDNSNDMLIFCRCATTANLTGSYSIEPLLVAWRLCQQFRMHVRLDASRLKTVLIQKASAGASRTATPNSTYICASQNTIMTSVCFRFLGLIFLCVRFLSA